MSDSAGKSNVALGKRKQRDDDQAAPQGSTLFVSNLPYAATSTDLQTLFSDIAPVRSAFVVTEQGTGTSKGVGYVSFAIKEDAKRALENIEKDGLELLGRKLRVQLADKKPNERNADSTIEKPKKPAPHPRQSFNKAAKDPNAIRTIIISGLPSSIDQKVLWKKIRKCDGAESVELVGEGEGIAHATFKSPANASHAVEKLHAHVFKGAILSVTLKKRLETLTKGSVGPAKTTGEGTSSGGTGIVPAPSRGSRLIVRNLPWDITETDLRALFLPYGPIYSVHIPAVSDSSKSQPQPQSQPPKTSAKARSRGFAFIWFFSRKDAERAIAGVNGKAVKAGAVARPTMNRKERARMRRAARRAAEGKPKDAKKGDEAEIESGSECDGGSESDSDEEKEENDSKERIVAVDWALSKEKWEKAKEEEGGVDVEAEADVEGGEVSEGSGGDTSSDEDDESQSGADGEGEEDEDDVNWVDEDDHSDASLGSASESNKMDVDDGDRSEDGEDGDVPTKPTLPKPEAGTTLFVRNLPFEATEDELRVLFRTFGPLRYARITMEHSSGRSRGTGFACFWNKEDADKAVKQCELVKRSMGVEAPKKNPFTLPTLLTPDPSSSLAQPLVLHGRTLDVAVAVTRDEAVKLKDEGERAREKADKRNLWLLREGVIFPNSPAASTLPPAELEKRLASFSTRRALLKSNPLLYISKTRLAVRQIPTFVSDKCLKKMAMHAVKAFEEEAKQGKREGINEEEKRRDVDEDAEEDSDKEDTSNKAKGKLKKQPKTLVKQSKIVRQSDRVDALTGKLKSKGYGFVEMGSHTDALRVLRWVNNNPAVGALVEGLWKEELRELVKNLEKGVSKDGKEKESNGEEGLDVEARIKRAKGELERLEGRSSGKGGKGGKTMVVEFSIENSQVVKRRTTVQKERAEASKETPSTPRKRFIDDISTSAAKRRKTSHGDTSSSKPRRAPSLFTSKKEKEFIDSTGKGVGKQKDGKEGSKLGGIIGRKRKMRSMKAARKGA